MESEISIAITHFINPHLFWYKTIEVSGEELHVLAGFEQSLLELYKNKPACDHLFRPQKGDKVAVNFIAWNKFIRAEVLQKAEFQQEEYIVWALDYGFPLLTKKEYLRILPSNLGADIGYIRVGGIANIYPGEQEYDDMEGNLVMVKKDKWLQKTCNMLEKLLADANSVSFFKHFQTENGHVWGDLIIVNHKGIEINAHEYLLKTTNAVVEDDLIFKTNCSKFKSTKIAPWLSNDRNTKLKYNNIKHNYIEHSKQMNAALVDENAKRKVEDWQERNERKNLQAAPETFDIICELSEDNIDDITFDDSVSVAHTQQINYIGKAGILTKIKQQKYSSEKHLPPSAPPKCYEFDDMISKLQCPKIFSTLSAASSYISATAEKQPDLCNKLDAKNDVWNENLNSAPNLFNIHNPNGCVSDLDTNSSLSSIVKMRKKNLLEMRMKIARGEKEMKINNSPASQQSSNQNETYNSTSQSKTVDSYPYRLLEQSLTTSASNNTASNYEQDNKSELSIKNIRVKHLMAMRKKFAPSSILSSTDGAQINSTTDSVVSANTNSSKTVKIVDNGNKSNMKSTDNLSFRLEPKIIKNTQAKIEQLPNTYSVNSAPKNELKESLKLSKSGYDSLTMVPAGFDITRLQTYKDEKNHWHRKTSTRNDYVPHENSSSTDELLPNNAHDKSFSSSDISQNKSLKGFSHNGNNQNNKAFNISKIESDSQLKTYSQQRDSNIESQIKNRSGNNLSNEISTSSNSSVLSIRQRKRRQLKSPNSQLLKIDKILMDHCIEKEKGNTNILDLQLLNTSSSSQKSLLASSSSNVSYKDINMAHNYIVRNSSSHSSSSGDNIQSEKVYKDVLNYETLMDVKNTETLPIVEDERKVQTKYIDHLVLAHSSIQLTSIENIFEAPFLPEIHEELRQMHFNKVYRIQVYSWSHVSRNNSLFVVNPSRSGKTWSYLPSLCSLICCRKDTFKPSYGPVAIILVASLKHVDLVNRYCTRLMSGFKNEAPTCVPSYGMRNLIKTKIHLLNGCGILVATPSNVLRLLHENENEPLFDADRLQHIVIDDMDIMMSRSQEDFEKAYTILFKMAKKSQFNKLLPQLIVTSRDWDGLMVKFIRKSNQPLLLIGDFLEAAVYGQATLSVKLKSNNKKNETILKFLKDISKSAENTDNRTLIICNEDEDVQNVYKFLQECGYSCLSFFSRSTDAEAITVGEWKNKVSSQILVCTDSRFCELKLQNVNNLIHYSLPTSWTQFVFRFSALSRTYNNFVSQFENSTLSTVYNANKMTNAYSMILLDENNNLQLPRLVDFMRKHNQIVQDEIQAVSRRVLVMREEQRILNILCPQLLEFGECDEPRCDYRHELTRFDAIKKSDNIPCTGEIRLHVLKVFSPTYYVVRLIHHKPANTVKWNEIRRSSEALTFSIQLNKYYSDENNLSLHWPPRTNDMCIFQYGENYRRALILEAPTFQQKELNVVQSHLKVTLKLIDEGSVISSVKCNEIFLCDEKFKDFPPQAIDVRLLKVVPFDNERCWDPKTTRQVQKWIIEEIKSNYVVQASVDFAFANTIWVKNVVVMEKLSGIDAYCQIVNLKKSLVEKNFGVLYNGDRKQVRDLVEEFDILNSSQFDVDTGDSDLDYQSCRNESEDLIKFSSSNDETANISMESAKTGLKYDKRIDLEEISKETKTLDKDNKTISNTDEENWDCLVCTEEVYDPFQISSTDKEVTTKEESWTKLNLNELIKVEIGDEGENGNWENIFLQTIDRNSMLVFDELSALIVEHVEKVKSKKEAQQKIYDFKPLHNCLVKYSNRYLRAKVYGIYGENAQRLYKFFLCDYACFTNAKTEELYNDFLYETTEEIVTFTPYQAIHCTLAGIKWDHFNKRYQVTKEYLYACAVVENFTDQNLQNLPINSYKILLYECEKESEFNNALLFNKTLLDNGITVCDEETKNFLEYEIGNPEWEEQNPNNSKNDEEEIVDIPKSYNQDKVLTFQQFFEYIKTDAFDIDVHDILKDIPKSETKSLNNNVIEFEEQHNLSESSKTTSDVTFDNKTVLKGESKIQTSDSETEEQGHCTSISNSSIKSSISLNSTDVSNRSELFLSPIPPLKALHKRPLTIWYQNDYMIFLSINAPDIEDYLLEVTSKTLVFMAKIQSEKSVLILNFLGSVDSKSVSHEIKGLNVIIRLKKNYFIKWPRLLQQSTKYSWLKYNFNDFDSKEMEYIEPQQVLQNILDSEFNNQNHKIENYNSDEDSERELYQTYNPIEGNDDEYDPFS